jgi:hypothetical protein
MDDRWFLALFCIGTGTFLFCASWLMWEWWWDQEKNVAAREMIGEDNLRATYMVMGFSMVVTGILFAFGVFD